MRRGLGLIDSDRAEMPVKAQTKMVPHQICPADTSGDTGSITRVITDLPLEEIIKKQTRMASQRPTQVGT